MQTEVLRSQGKAAKTRKFATVKRMMKPSDPRLYVSRPVFRNQQVLISSLSCVRRKENIEKAAKKVEAEKKQEEKKKMYVPSAIPSDES